jgi:hypothetical protein
LGSKREETQQADLKRGRKGGGGVELQPLDATRGGRSRRAANAGRRAPRARVSGSGAGAEQTYEHSRGHERRPTAKSVPTAVKSARPPPPLCLLWEPLKQGTTVVVLGGEGVGGEHRGMVEDEVRGAHHSGPSQLFWNWKLKTSSFGIGS